MPLIEGKQVCCLSPCTWDDDVVFIFAVNTHTSSQILLSARPHVYESCCLDIWQHYGCVHNQVDDFWLLLKGVQEALPLLRLNAKCIFYDHSYSGDPIVVNTLLNCEVLLTVKLHHILAENKCIVTKEEIRKWDVAVWQGIWWRSV